MSLSFGPGDKVQRTWNSEADSPWVKLWPSTLCSSMPQSHYLPNKEERTVLGVEDALWDCKVLGVSSFFLKNGLGTLSASAALILYVRLVGLNNRNWPSCRKGIQGQGAGRVGFLRGLSSWLAAATFSLCPHKVQPLCMPVPGVSLGLDLLLE